MSQPSAATDAPPPDPLARPSGRSARGAWAWTAIACILLGASGVVRAVQDRRHKDEASYLETCPFPLKELPGSLGVWRARGGDEARLDDLTMRITGGTDYCMRTYVDELTGVSLVVLVLFGPAEPVIPHTPEVCFPSSGFEPADQGSDRLVKLDDGKEALFRSGVYAKPGGRATLREEVYHSFRLEGAWSPRPGAGRKFPRRNPGVFKVQVQRRVAEGERRDRDDPIEHFLGALIPEIERRIGAGRAGVGGGPAPAKTSVGGVGTLPAEGEVRAERVPRVAGGRTAPGRPGGRRPEEAGPAEGADEGAGPADQADRQDHRGQVDGQREADREADRVDPVGEETARSAIRAEGIGAAL